MDFSRKIALFALALALLALPACASPATPGVTAAAPVIILPTATIGYLPFTATPTLTPFPLPPKVVETPIPTRTLGIRQTLLPLSTVIPTVVMPATRVPDAGCVPDNPMVMGVVIEIVSGDTFRVMIDGETYSVRYIGIRAPQNDRTNSPKAALENARLVYGKLVGLVMDQTDVDANGVLPRYVFAENQFINFMLVKSGMASAFPSAPDSACDETFAQAQTLAEKLPIGMWEPTPSYGPTPAYVCECDRDRFNCTKEFFYSQAQAQACFTYCNKMGAGDIHGLDRDGDGLACNSLLP